jgi:hypothetical protein
LTFDRRNFVLLQGAPSRFVSSPGVVRSFCAVCGTQLTYATENRRGDIDVTTISLDDDAKFPPTCEVWMSHKVSWEAADFDREQHPREMGE